MPRAHARSAVLRGLAAVCALCYGVDGMPIRIQVLVLAATLHGLRRYCRALYALHHLKRPSSDASHKGAEMLRQCLASQWQTIVCSAAGMADVWAKLISPSSSFTLHSKIAAGPQLQMPGLLIATG